MARDKFESRLLINPLTVVAVLDYLNNNFEEEKPLSLQVILIIKPRRVDESDFCSREKEETRKIKVKNAEDISELGKFLLENLFMDWTHVAISEREKDLV